MTVHNDGSSAVFKEVCIFFFLARYGFVQNDRQIMAGAHGVLKNVKELCENLVKDDQVQVVVVCGKNTALKESLSALEAENGDKLKVLGYVSDSFRISSKITSEEFAK